ncbi:hypothetical protein DFH08DRAFT_1013396 [Mycena albidolilacea]|uniref:Protein YTP1-like C-terminal domain-containing protein n=1 Tax=Mycena albidolilacea TaxID=1033008 RepID=A0AAD6ZUD8_9AGAR|nr:hypothetical protein DFH08DRAFT_1013396 [Mycena albidolilacea]
MISPCRLALVFSAGLVGPRIRQQNGRSFWLASLCFSQGLLFTPVVVEKSISMAVWHTSSASPFHLANLSSNPLSSAEGGIFWCYGLISFARFLGWSSERGWAWNRAPSAGYSTPEMVESTVIFLYGATNTWMERFSANPGDPFTTKKMQHIGITVMFWFAGSVGMAIESKTVRKWLSTLGTDPSESVSEPEDHTSFNPVLALVISVTGAVMGVHFQTYLFQVQIHALWGNLLVAFGLLRCLTYFFLWVAPVRSTLPSRPPTELLARSSSPAVV